MYIKKKKNTRSTAPTLQGEDKSYFFSNQLEWT